MLGEHPALAAMISPGKPAKHPKILGDLLVKTDPHRGLAAIGIGVLIESVEAVLEQITPAILPRAGEQPNQPHRAHHWHPEWEALRDFKQHELTALAAERLVDLVDGRRDLGVYKLGTQRTLDEYARFAGIHYAQRSFVQDYRDGYSWDA
jgi:hypothetical protein